MTDERWEAIMRFFNRVFDKPDEFYDEALILSLSDEEMTQIFTKKRLEIIRTIKRKHPKTMSELANTVKRELAAVNRDLKILEGLGIVKLERKGRKVKPLIDKKVLILPLVPVKPQTIEQYERRMMAR